MAYPVVNRSASVALTFGRYKVECWRYEAKQRRESLLIALAATCLVSVRLMMQPQAKLFQSPTTILLYLAVKQIIRPCFTQIDG